jgi:hypothetical protein
MRDVAQEIGLQGKCNNVKINKTPLLQTYKIEPPPFLTD